VNSAAHLRGSTHFWIAIAIPLGNAVTATTLKNKVCYRYPVTGWI
jgi:hypothetical protein